VTATAGADLGFRPAGVHWYPLVGTRRLPLATTTSAPGGGEAGSVFYHVPTRTGRDYPAAVSDTLLCATGLMLLALLMAITELVRRRSHRLNQPAPTPRPEHDLHRV